MDRQSEQPSPRWLVWCAWGAFLCTVPSAIWREVMIWGFLPGGDALREFYINRGALAGLGYVTALSVVQLLCGFLTLGLIYKWGEELFGWRVPVSLAVGIAAIGGLTVTWLFDIGLLPFILQGGRPDQGLMGTGLHYWIMVAAYIPIFFWGPLELIATWGYWRRRTGRLD